MKPAPHRTPAADGLPAALEADSNTLPAEREAVDKLATLTRKI